MREMKLQDLKTKSPVELLAFADEHQVENASTMRKQELMFAILKQLAQKDAEILQVWRGGMSFHGALIGSGLGLLLFARNHAVPARSVMDLCCAAVPFGLLFGRIANFINSEHWGRVTDAAIGMVFPNGGPEPRHPSQLYEAALEGLVMLVIMRIMTHRVLALKRPGLTAGVWLVWYGIARMISEFFREPESAHAFNLGPFTAGQMYSIPMLAFGAWLIWHARRNAEAERAVT